MDFPLQLLSFKLVDYKADEEDLLFVRYVAKKEKRIVYTSLEKYGPIYLHKVTKVDGYNEDSYSRSYRTLDTASEAMLSWLLTFSV